MNTTFVIIIANLGHYYRLQARSGSGSPIECVPGKYTGIEKIRRSWLHTQSRRITMYAKTAVVALIGASGATGEDKSALSSAAPTGSATSLHSLQKFDFWKVFVERGYSSGNMLLCFSWRCEYRE